MPFRLYRGLLSWIKYNRNRRITVMVTAFLLLGGLVLLATDIRREYTPLDGTIRRNAYGEGEKEENYRIKIGKKRQKESVQATISEQQYTTKEIQRVFKQAAEQMEPWILGDNKSLNKVETNMELIKQVPGQPIDVEWELDRYDVMNVNGELQTDQLQQSGTVVQVKATLTYTQNPKEQAQFQCAAKIYPKALSNNEKQVSKVESLIQKADKKERTKKEWKLPSVLDNKKIAYYKETENRGVTVLVLAILVGLLLVALEKQNKHKAIKEERKQMLLDYPEVVSKLTLLLSAGMTVKNAWKKMVLDYEAQKKTRGERKIYEEMQVTLHEMHSGITEAESYERFGRRCQIQVYLKLGALLSQNLRKGTKGLNQMLKLESIQAFEERKANAKRLGEEAGTKLLLPMFLMLALVLIIVVVPAFLSIQI